MKTQIAWALSGVIGIALLAGCSSETRNDIKRDVNDAARKVDSAVKDAVD